VRQQADALLRDFGEEALDEIEPGGTGRREVQMEAAMIGEPALHRGRLVRPVVVEHEMNIQMPLHAPVDTLEELDELFRAMPGMALADDKARLHVKRSEQRRGAVALVVWVIVAARPFFKGRPGWVRSSA
jgi:hypothetical protein